MDAFYHVFPFILRRQKLARYPVWIMQKQLALIFRHTVPKRAAAVECQSLRYANVLRCPNMQSESYGPKPWIDGAAPSSVR